MSFCASAVVIKLLGRMLCAQPFVSLQHLHLCWAMYVCMFGPNETEALFLHSCL